MGFKRLVRAHSSAVQHLLDQLPGFTLPELSPLNEDEQSALEDALLAMVENQEDEEPSLEYLKFLLSEGSEGDEEASNSLLQKL